MTTRAQAMRARHFETDVHEPGITGLREMRGNMKPPKPPRPPEKPVRKVKR